MRNLSVPVVFAALLWPVAFAAAAETQPQSPAPHQSDITAPASAGRPPTMPEGAYPLLSTILGEQGDTILKFTIKEDGTITDIKVAQSSGYARLDEAAVEGAKDWRYKPAMQNGKPVAVSWIAQVRWKLAEDPDSMAAQGFATLQATLADYPEESLKRGDRGITIVGMKIGRDGSVSAMVFRSSGHPELDDASLRLAQRTKDKPAEVEGAAVDSLIPLVVIWSPDGK